MLTDELEKAVSRFDVLTECLYREVFELYFIVSI